MSMPSSSKPSRPSNPPASSAFLLAHLTRRRHRQINNNASCHLERNLVAYFNIFVRGIHTRAPLQMREWNDTLPSARLQSEWNDTLPSARDAIFSLGGMLGIAPSISTASDPAAEAHRIAASTGIPCP